MSNDKKLLVDFLELKAKEESLKFNTEDQYLNFAFTPNSDWEDIMMVVEKIESIEDDYNVRFEVFISGNQCTIQSTRLYKLVNGYFNEEFDETKLTATYKACLNFVKWYNDYRLDKNG